jgi:uncharacterized protein YggU (UPF0235/DUF167 family)
MAELVRVRVKPGSAKGPLVEAGGEGELVVYVRERAIDGAANAAVERVVAAYFGVSPSRVSIRNGRTSRRKTLEVVR